MSVCDMNCLECKFSDCINDEDMTLEERAFSKEYERRFKKELEPSVIPEIGMTRYIHNRPDKEAYEKARNAKYEAKRKGRPDRVEHKRRQYQRHREEKLAYQKQYYDNNKDEILAKRKSRHEANKEEINRKRREAYKARKEKERLENSKKQQTVCV